MYPIAANYPNNISQAHHSRCFKGLGGCMCPIHVEFDYILCGAYPGYMMPHSGNISECSLRNLTCRRRNLPTARWKIVKDRCSLGMQSIMVRTTTIFFVVLKVHKLTI